jgi:ligand-binding sensor protein
MPQCPNCGKEISEETNYCPFCGSIFQSSRILLTEENAETRHNEIVATEEIAEARHNETVATMTCAVGLLIFLMGLFIQPSDSGLFATGILNLLLMFFGMLIMISMAILTIYYYEKRKRLMRK